jgi:hypothetical protein
LINFLVFGFLHLLGGAFGVAAVEDAAAGVQAIGAAPEHKLFFLGQGSLSPKAELRENAAPPPSAPA